VSVASPKMDPWRALDQWRKYGELGPGNFSLADKLRLGAMSVGTRLLLRLAGATLHVQSSGDEAFRDDLLHSRRSFIFLAWHNRVAGLLTYHDLFGRRRVDYRLETIVSASRDGEPLARLIRENGGGVIRGSSSRDGVAALKQAIDRISRGFNLGTVGDGPRGPRYQLKPGPILLGKLTGLPIVPFTWACNRVAQLHRAWDQMMIPLPFASMEYRFGQPLQIAPDAGARELVAARREMEARLNALTQWADTHTGVAWQIPKPKPNEILKRRPRQVLADKRQ